VRREDQARPALDRLRVGSHDLEDLVERAVIEDVDLVVHPGDPAGIVGRDDAP